MGFINPRSLVRVQSPVIQSFGRPQRKARLALALLLTGFHLLAVAAAAAPPAEKPAASRPAAPWRALADYPRPPAPDTGWGIHDNPNCIWKADNLNGFFRDLRRRYGFTWFKVLACGANKLDVVAACRRNGIEPVVRLYVDRPAPHYPRPGREEAEFR